jgi:hypothetical protein
MSYCCFQLWFHHTRFQVHTSMIPSYHKLPIMPTTWNKKQSQHHPTQCKWINPPSMPHTFRIFSPFFYKGQFCTNHDYNRNPKNICICRRQWAWFSLGIPIIIGLAPSQCTKSQHTHSSISPQAYGIIQTSSQSH